MARVWVACAVVAVVWVLALPRADAQTVEPRIQISQRVSGPYRLSVFAQPPEPVAGLGLRFSVEVVVASSGQPVNNATVELTMTNPKGGLEGPVTFLRQPNIPGLYATLIELDQAGAWGYRITAAGPEGAGEVDGAITARTREGAGWPGVIAWVITLAVLVGGGLVAWLTMRRRRWAPRISSRP